MTITALIVLASAIFVCAVCTVLVFHPEYDDGLIRRLALAILALTSFMRVTGILEHLQNCWEAPRAFGHVAILAWIGMALFFGDHFYNFLRKLKASRQRQRRLSDRTIIQS